MFDCFYLVLLYIKKNIKKQTGDKCVHVTVTYQLRERKSTVAEPVTPAIAFYVCIVHSKWFESNYNTFNPAVKDKWTQSSVYNQLDSPVCDSWPL